jgi:hypothetical protein
MGMGSLSTRAPAGIVNAPARLTVTRRDVPGLIAPSPAARAT